MDDVFDFDVWLNGELEMNHQFIIDHYCAPPRKKRTEIVEILKRYKGRILYIYVQQDENPREPDYVNSYQDENGNWCLRDPNHQCVGRGGRIQSKSNTGFTLLFHGVHLIPSIFGNPIVTMSFKNRLDLVDIYNKLEALLCEEFLN
jgi:hypothetical protein